MGGSLAWDIYLNERGCCNITDACTDREEFERIYDLLEVRSAQIDITYNNGIFS